jgi:ADP-dependent NAD(P)H-hydrate dehydratase / NAD(P)H-hydrate epimerase
MPQAIYLTRDIRDLERKAGELPLMERAGSAAADLAATLVPGDKKDILVLAGPGNNGGDARIAAARLEQGFFRVKVVSHPRELPHDRNWGLVIDGLFGIGLARAISGDYAELVQYANRQRCPVLALDVPSGIQSDTGQVLGCAVRATHTITFIALKPGLLTLDGPDHCGELRVASLDIDFSKAKPNAWVADRALFPSALKPRPRNFHKGNAGSLGIVGGARGMSGAALLAGRAALKLGSGRVYVGLLEHLAVDFGAPELMLRHVDDVLGQDLDAVVAGPGLGRTEHAATLVGAVLASDWPCALDADALNLLSDDENLRQACERRSADTLLTPHPAEAARLLKSSVAEVQNDRIAAARAMSQRYNSHVVLKGNGSVLIARDGHLFINSTGNPGMASAGMGDVLAGIVAGIVAQGVDAPTATRVGVCLHSYAADRVAARDGQRGLLATDLLPELRAILNESV